MSSGRINYLLYLVTSRVVYLNKRYKSVSVITGYNIISLNSLQVPCKPAKHPEFVLGKLERVVESLREVFDFFYEPVRTLNNVFLCLCVDLYMTFLSSNAVVYFII